MTRARSTKYKSYNSPTDISVVQGYQHKIAYQSVKKKKINTYSVSHQIVLVLKQDKFKVRKKQQVKRR